MAALTTTRVVKIAVIGSLYAALTIVVAPISYGPAQFRIAEIFKIFVLFDPYATLGIGLGTFFANLASPFVGPWELIWMPLTDIVGGLAAWGLFRLMRQHWPAIPMGLYAVTTGAAVGLMLFVLGFGGFWYLAAFVTLSELVILVGGIPVIWMTIDVLKRRGLKISG